MTYGKTKVFGISFDVAHYIWMTFTSWGLLAYYCVAKNQLVESQTMEDPYTTESDMVKHAK
jgi:hypothetical protein